jgi:3-deoxy-D-manno-octulosonic-acid transferase
LKRKAIFLLYRVLQALVSPVFLLYLLWRSVRNSAYLQSLPERFGFLPFPWRQTVPGAIWLHAVSVGEVLAAAPLIEELRHTAPDTPLFLSVGTLTGRAVAEKRVAGTVRGVFYAPFDFVWIIRRVLRLLRPSAVVILETEIWPNLFNEAARIGCGVMLVNGRISDRALGRYRRFRIFFSAVLSLCDRILAQSDTMRARFAAIGAPPEVVETGGNLKYDFPPPTAPSDPRLQDFVRAVPGKKLWIAASTSADREIDEEDAVIAAQRELPGWRLVVAPRHPERFGAAAGKLRASGLRWTRRTALDNPQADVLLLDSIGELSGMFAFADAVFMGGTLAQKGGHNVLEPAVFGKPIVAGPHLENFPDIEAAFSAARAFLRITGGGELRNAIIAAAADRHLGRRALEAAESQRGAAARCAKTVLDVCASKYPCYRPAQPGYAVLWFFSTIWRAASARDRNAKLRRRRALPVPVISVGNITTGGTGKTPVTIELLRAFQPVAPAVLTRGHGRSTKDVVVALPGDDMLPIDLTGDEAQFYLRAGFVPVGIAAERFDAGEALLAQFTPGLFLLDDGFQHLQLARNFDLVLVDALDPFGCGYLLPLGRLREPLDGLKRASAFLITHSDEAPSTRGIEFALRRYNPEAPVFKARTRPERWADATGNAWDLAHFADTPAVAFCGLGNPESFWRSLDSIGLHPVDCHNYGDHHRYPPAEVRRLARHAIQVGANVLLTTAKDSVNLPPDFESLISPLKLYWLEIRIEIERRDDLIRRIEAATEIAKKI